MIESKVLKNVKFVGRVNKWEYKCSKIKDLKLNRSKVKPQKNVNI